MKNNLVFICTVALILGPLLFVDKLFAETPPSKPIIGWAEKVQVYPSGALMHAKIVPAEESTTVHASDIKGFKKDKRKWVSFVLSDRAGIKFPQEREVLRVVSIKTDGPKKKKIYLVQLGICLGGVYQEAEVRLADRGSKAHRVLIGRNVLAGNVLVDPTKSFRYDPKCSIPTPTKAEEEATEE